MYGRRDAASTRARRGLERGARSGFRALRAWRWRVSGRRLLVTVVLALLGALTAVVEAALQQRALTLQAVIVPGCLLVAILITQSLLEPGGPPGEAAGGQLPAPALVRQERLARAELIGQMRDRVETELSQSLNRRAGTRLGVVPEAEDYVLKRPHRADQAVRRGTPIREVYEQVDRQLLLLGEPGSGKTDLLLELAGSLLDEAQRSDGARVPVVFHLPSWAAERRPLEEWLGDQLTQDYGVAPAVVRIWLATEHVVPLLDELDQVAEAHRAECVEAINRFHERHGQLPLVVCSRVQEYEEASVRLDVRGALVVPLMSRAHVAAYVRRARRHLGGLAKAIREDPGLCDLLTTPLLLSVAALTYEGDTVATSQGGTLIERRRRLLADYVTAMLERRPADAQAARYRPAQTVAWLAWLARAMQAHGQMVFYVDRLQPDWLPTRGRRLLATAGVTAACVLLYVLVMAVLAGAALAVAVVAGGGGVVPAALAALLLPRLTPVVLLTVAGAAALALTVHERTIEPMRWSRPAFQRALPSMAVRGAIAGALLVAAAALLVQPSLRLPLVLLGSAGIGVPIGVGVSLWFASNAGYAPSDDAAPAAPGRDIGDLRRAALANALVSVLVVGPVVAVASGLALQLSVGETALPAVAIAGLFAVPLVALLAGLRRGGAAYARHLAVRWLLAREGSAALDLVGFLTYATQLNLLRRQGGGYEFVYPLLRRYFEELAA